MARTKDEQRRINAERMAGYRAKKKAVLAPAKTPGMVAADAGGSLAMPGLGEDEPQVRVNVGEQLPKLSLKERILSKVQGNGSVSSAPIKRAVGRPKKSQDNLLSTVAPTIIASFTATYSSQLIADPYKPCAPSQDEVTGVVGPLFDILARQVEITGKASQTTIDLINSIVCASMYSIRAYVTYVDIKNMEKSQHEKPVKTQQATASDTSSSSATGDTSISSGLRAYQNETARPFGHTGSQYADRTYAATAETNDAGRYTADSDGHSEGRDSEAALVADMFRRDIRGRVRLGLLSGELRSDN